MFNNRFLDRVAVITGGASGAGLAVAERIVAEGGKVAVWDLNKSAFAAAQAETGAQLCIEVDVTDPASIDAAAAQTVAQFGRLDLLLNSAGVTGPTTPALEYPRVAFSFSISEL